MEEDSSDTELWSGNDADSDADSDDSDELLIQARSAATDFIAFLERCQSGTEPHPTRLPALWHQHIDEWPPDDLRVAARLAESNATVRTLTMDESIDSSLGGAARIASVLRNFRNAQELVIGATTGRQRERGPPYVRVDMLLHGMVGSHARLTTLRLSVGGGDKAMFEFLERFPTISTIELGERDRPLAVTANLVSAFARHWVSRESNLQRVTLRCCRMDALAMARLLYPLGCSPRLKVLEVDVSDAAVLEDVCVACAASRSIETLAIACPRNDDDDRPLDVSRLWGYRGDFPDTLRSLSLRNCRVRFEEAEADTGPHHMPRSAWWRLEGLELVSCDAPPLFRFLERMPNVERLQTCVRDDEIEGPQVPDMIDNTDLDALARALPPSKVNQLSLYLRPRDSLHSLVALLQNGTGSIDLTFRRCFWPNVDAIRSALEAMNPAVTTLGLRFVECEEGDADYARFFQVLMSVGRPSNLESLTMQLNPGATDLRHTCDSLLAILPPSSLRALKILLVNASAYEFVAESCLAGLAQNRVLQELRLDASQPNDNSGPFVVPAATVSRLHEVLKSNGVLGEFGGGQFDLSDPMVNKVRFLLKQNRLGRRVLLDPASPAGLWPRVLSLVSKAGAADIMFHYLRSAETDVLRRCPLPPQTFPRTFKKRPRSDSPVASNL